MKRRDAVIYAKERLSNLGSDAQAEAEWLLALALDIKRGEVYLDTQLTDDQEQAFMFALKAREKGEPLAYIFHSANFYGYDLEVDKNVLIPRPETEELVELILKEEITEKTQILDIGTGSGAIAITLAKESKAKLTAVDISDGAIKIAKTNAVRNNAKVKFVKSDLFSKLEDMVFDIIVSNPPYINEEEYNSLEISVKDYEPKTALYGGKDGLYFYCEIIKKAPKYLKNKGKIFFEIGYNQAKDVCGLLEKDFENIKVKKDLQGQDRMVYATLKERR